MGQMNKTKTNKELNKNCFEDFSCEKKKTHSKKVFQEELNWDIEMVNSYSWSDIQLAIVMLYVTLKNCYDFHEYSITLNTTGNNC